MEFVSDRLLFHCCDCWVHHLRFVCIYRCCVCGEKKDWKSKMDPVKMETMESAASNKKSVINQMSTHVWNLFAKTNLFALCCVGAFLSLVRISFETIFVLFMLRSFAIEKNLYSFVSNYFKLKEKSVEIHCVHWYGLRKIRHIEYYIRHTYCTLITYIHVVIDQKNIWR